MKKLLACAAAAIFAVALTGAAATEVTHTDEVRVDPTVKRNAAKAKKKVKRGARKAAARTRSAANRVERSTEAAVDRARENTREGVR